MRLQESGEMYLETILILSQKGSVRSVDVSEYMNFSKPSVSRAIGILKKGGFVETNQEGDLLLTRLGRAKAEKTYERHRLLTDYFMRLGVPKEIAAEDACKIEHDLSDITFEAIKKHANCQKC